MTVTWQSWLEPLRRLRTSRGRRTAQQFSMEGYRLIERALRAGLTLRVVLVNEALVHDPTTRWQVLREQLEDKSIPIVPIPPAALEEFIEGRTFGSLIAIAPLPTPPPLSEFLQKLPQPGSILVLDRVRDHGNLGALIRTAMASDMKAMILLNDGDPWHPKAVRTSMGALFLLPVYRIDGEQELLSLLQKHEFQSVGAVCEGGEVASRLPMSQRCAFWMGSEAHGLSDWLQSNLDTLCTIPMYTIVDSFSVNAATAILLYEWNRRRAEGSAKGELTLH